MLRIYGYLLIATLLLALFGHEVGYFPSLGLSNSNFGRIGFISARQGTVG